MQSKILDKNVVRIKLNNDEYGTGIIFDNPEESEFLYVFTAKHVLYDDKKGINNTLETEAITVQHCLDVDNFMNFKVVNIISSKIHDFSILFINRDEYTNKIGVESYKLVKKIGHIKPDLVFKGFPKKLECKEPHKINAELNEAKNSSIEIKSTDGEFFDFEDDGLQNAKGFSGSGIFVRYLDDSLELAGIIISYKGFRSLKGYFFANEVNALLHKNGFKPIIDLIEKPKHKINFKKAKKSKTDYFPKDYYENVEGENLIRLKQKIFPLIYQGQAVLILGPNLLNEKESLSEKYIKSYNEKFKTGFTKAKDVIDFVDVVFSNENYSRTEFDTIAYNYLNSLSIPDIYKYIPIINWKALITVNADKLLDQAYDDEEKKNQELLQVSMSKEFKTATLPNELQYIKLNGDIRDRGKYPLVFSTKDFMTVKSFYEKIKSYLNDFSTNIPIIALGFNQQDEYSQNLLDRIVLKRPIYVVDNTIDDFRLNSAKEANKYIIKTKPNTFFDLYKKWIGEEAETQVRKKRQLFVNKEDKLINLPNDIRLKLNNNIVQIGGRSKYDNIRQREFYEGAEANFSVVENDYDVPKRLKLNTVKVRILKCFEETINLSMLILTGGFGTGKSTFTLRLIKELINENNILAFHVIDFVQLKVTVLNELVGRSKCNKIILYTDHIEKDSVFSALFRFFKELQADFNSDIKIVILSSIRENILNKLNKSKIYSSFFNAINIDTPFTLEETENLVEKWQTVKIYNYRDNQEKANLINRITNDYNGDTLTASYNLINSSKHSSYIRNAYEELNPIMQKAFIYTALLHRYKILMPFGLLRDVLAKDNNEFESQVIQGEGFGIINHKVLDNVVGLNPDVYFSTRHPTIAEELIKLKLNNQKTQYRYYNTLIENFKNNEYYSKEIINLLKALEKSNSLSTKFIDNLYDTGGKIFDKDPHFTLHYAMNLQSRDRIKGGNYSKIDNHLIANNLIQYVRSVSEESIYNRNHFLIHRQGVISFNLARFYLEEYNIIDAQKHFNIATEYFETKKVLDPDSVYSYLDFIRLNLWGLINARKLEWNNYELSELKNLLEILFDEANYVYEDKTKIKELEGEYNRKYRSLINIDELESIDDELEKHEETSIVQVLVQLYYQYSNKKGALEKQLTKKLKGKTINEDLVLKLKGQISLCSERIEKLIEKLSYYEEQESVTMILFRHLGRSLHIPDHRIRFHGITRNYNYIEKKDKLRYHFYNFIASSYDNFFQNGFEHLSELRKHYGFRLNPNNYQEWKTSTGESNIFIGNLKEKHGRRYVKIREFQRDIPIIKGKIKKTNSRNPSVRIIIYFFLNGLKAEIISDGEK